MMRAIRLFVPVLLVTVVLSASPGAAQIPDSFTNLKLLDPGTSRDSMVATMREWASALGVRCNYCHVGPEDLQGMDFASDEKATKRTARRMLEMTRAINGQLLASLPTAEGEDHQAVSCYTCHRRQTEPPRSIGTVLGEVADREGVGAALEEFRRLRREYREAGVYDLSVTTLARLAQRLVEGGRTDDALVVLDEALTLEPDSTDVLLTKALVLAQSGAIEAALSTLDRALVLEPDNERLRRMKERLSAPSAKPPGDG